MGEMDLEEVMRNTYHEDRYKTRLTCGGERCAHCFCLIVHSVVMPAVTGMFVVCSALEELWFCSDESTSTDSHEDRQKKLDKNTVLFYLHWQATKKFFCKHHYKKNDSTFSCVIYL